MWRWWTLQVHLDAVCPSVDNTLRSRRRLHRVGDLEVSDCHVAQGTDDRIRRNGASRNQNLTRRTNSGPTYFSRFDALPKVTGVCPHRAKLKHARESVSCHHLLELS